MASTLQVHGFHYEGDVELFAEIGRRKDTVSRARQGNRKRKNPQTVCADLKRDSRGRFLRS